MLFKQIAHYINSKIFDYKADFYSDNWISLTCTENFVSILAIFSPKINGGCVEADLDLRSFIHEGWDQHTSCTAHHGEPLLCPCLRTTCNFFLLFFWAG